jgi:hypothetical protein
VREADYSPPSSVEVKNAWSYTSMPPIRLHGPVVLSYSTGTTALYLYLTTDVLCSVKTMAIFLDHKDPCTHTHVCPHIIIYTRTWRDVRKFSSLPVSKFHPGKEN